MLFGPFGLYEQKLRFGIYSFHSFRYFTIFIAIPFLFYMVLSYAAKK